MRPRHLVKAPIRTSATAAAGHLLDVLRAQGSAALTQRDDQLTRRAVKAHRMPILSTGCAWTCVDPLPNLAVQDVFSIARRAVVRIEARPDVLKDRLDVTFVLARDAVVFPEDTVFSDGEHPLLTVS